MTKYPEDDSRAMFGVGIPAIHRMWQERENDRVRELLRDPNSDPSRAYTRELADRIEARMIARSIEHG